MREMNSWRRRVAAAAVAAVIGTIASPACAQNLLDTLIGIFGRPPPPASPVLQPPPDLPAPAPPLHIVITPQRPGPSHGIAGYCVRLCDGRYFPLPRLRSTATPAKLCEAMCPQSRTMVLWGGSIDRARAANGSRYADLEAAFDYRNRIVPGCTCNGTDASGTAAISLRADMTLRPGDAVMTKEGMKVFVGTVGDRHEDRDFVSVQDYAGLSADQRRMVSDFQLTRRSLVESPVLDFNTRFVFDASPLPPTMTLPVSGSSGPRP